MGNIFRKSKKNKEQPKTKKEVQKDRVNDQDKTILDIRTRIRKVKTYIKKLEEKIKDIEERAKEHVRAKDKRRALLALKQKKFVTASLESAQGAEFKMEEMVHAIEDASMNVDVYKTLKEGDDLLADLQKKVSMKDFEEIYENQEERN